MSFLEQKKIDVRVSRSNRKSMKMTVNADGSVTVVAPESLSEEKIMELLDSKKSWIISKVNQRLAAGHCYNKPIGENNEAFSFLGRECTLSIQNHNKKSQVQLKNGELIVLHKNENPNEIRLLIENWFRKKTEEEVNFWIKCYQPQFETSPNRIVIKEQKRRWGSCSSKNNLNFNWRLSMMPTWVISYIVLHELCHFEEMNHSEAFWQAVERRMPEYNEAKKWLKENGHRYLPE